MIQRVQTLFLFLAAAFMAGALLMPVATFFGSGEEFAPLAEFFGDGGKEVVIRGTTMWPLAVLFGLTTGLLVVNIFLYKNRWLQLRLCFSALVLTLGSAGMVAWHVWRISTYYGVVSGKVSLAAVFPLAAFVLVILAIRGIVRDDRLVKSLDRLR